MKRFFFLVVSLAVSCGSNDTWPSVDADTPTPATYMPPFEKAPYNPCPPPMVGTLPDGGEIMVIIPCRSGEISTRKGASDPPGWGQEDNPGAVDPAPPPPREPPGDPVPF